MADRLRGVPEHPAGSSGMSLSEKLMCEWEARHDVAARGRRVDPAGALHRYLTHTRIEEEQRHRNAPAHRVASPSVPHGEGPAEFAAEHPLAASWLRWGEDSH